MAYALRRLLLGLALIAAAAAVLLLSDWRNRAASNPAAAGAGRTWRVHFVNYTESTMVEECHRGFFGELPRLGLTAGKELEVRVSNAQGEMATLTALLDAALTERADVVLLTSTPALQAAIKKVREVPVLFSVVANPVLAGAGSTYQNHLANVTGISTCSDYEAMAAVIRECLPGVRRVGTLYVSSEDNAVFNKDSMAAVLRRDGVELDAVAVSTSSEVSDAALSLAGREIGAICQVLGNVTDAAFAGITIAARKARRPLLAFSSAQAEKGGAALAVSRDYEQAGRDLARLLERIMKGESPAAIPFQLVSRTRLVVNLDNAALCGLTVPPELLSRADEVIGERWKSR